MMIRSLHAVNKIRHMTGAVPKPQKPGRYERV